MKNLDLGWKLRVPVDEAVTETLAILGRRGSGKTYTAGVFVEELLGSGFQVVVVDPIDVWWGLRSSADGKSSGYPITIFGGEHEDLPLLETAGAVLADAIVEGRFSAILSLRHLSKNGLRRFVADFGERLYERKGAKQYRSPLHLVFDEADTVVPQRLFDGGERCYGAVDTLIRRGRSSGIGATLVSQRAAVIAKDVLTQVEVMVAHQTTGPQDRKALETWIEAHDTGNRKKAFLDSVAGLPRGVAWFWSPAWLDIFQQVHVRRKRTFDSSSTPKAGERQAAPKKLAPVELDALRDRIAETIERAKADDPRELRKKIAELEKQVSAKVVKVPPPVLDKKELKRLEQAVEDLDTLFTSVEATAQEIREQSKELSATKIELGKILDAVRGPHPGLRVQDFVPSFPASLPVQRPKNGTSNGASKEMPVSGGLQRMLVALAQSPRGLSSRQLGLRAGLSSKSGTFKTYLSKARTEKWVEGGGDLMRITEAGHRQLPPSYSPLPTGAALRDYWLRQLGGGAARMLEALAEVYPRALTNEGLGEKANLSANSGTFKTYLSRLRTLELVTGRGELRASEELFS